MWNPQSRRAYEGSPETALGDTLEASLKVGPGGWGESFLESFWSHVVSHFGEARIGRSTGNSLFPALPGKLAGKLPGMAFPFEKPSLFTAAATEAVLRPVCRSPWLLRAASLAACPSRTVAAIDY